MIERLARKVTRGSLKKFAEGIVLSKLRYCLAVYGSTMLDEGYREGRMSSTAFSKKDLISVQVILNRLARLLTGERKGTPTTELMKKADMLSMQQEVAKNRMMMVMDMMATGKPRMLANKTRIESWEYIPGDPQKSRPIFRIFREKSR
jgi:hypothetical protein